ncbi:MAG: hypothetical protein ACK5KU_03565 [Beutenbergiaceae bacterium]
MSESSKPPEQDRAQRIRYGIWIVGGALGLYWIISGIYGLVTHGG